VNRRRFTYWLERRGAARQVAVVGNVDRSVENSEIFRSVATGVARPKPLSHRRLRSVVAGCEHAPRGGDIQVRWNRAV
jgi:hypothetical protein